jgi:hypothetical protein
MLLAPRRQHGDDTQAHREETGGDEEECEEGYGESPGEKKFSGEEDFDCQEVCEEETLSRKLGDEEVVDSRREVAGRVQSEA